MKRISDVDCRASGAVAMALGSWPTAGVTWVTWMGKMRKTTCWKLLIWYLWWNMAEHGGTWKKPWVLDASILSPSLGVGGSQQIWESKAELFFYIRRFPFTSSLTTSIKNLQAATWFNPWNAFCEQNMQFVWFQSILRLIPTMVFWLVVFRYIPEL